MGFLARLFKKNKSPKITKQQQVHINKQQETAKQIAQLDSLEQAQLQQLVSSSDDSQLQVKAIAYMSDITSLSTIIKAKQSNKVLQAAQQQLANLLDSGEISLTDIETALELKQGLSVVAKSKKPELPAQLLSSVTEQGQFFDLALSAGSASIRQLAAERLQEPQLISELVKQSKGKDKVVYRIAKNQQDAFKAEQQAQLILQEKIQSVSDGLEQLSTRSYDPQFSAKLKLLETQWLEYQPKADSVLQQKTQQAISACQAIIALEAEQEAQIQVRKAAIASVDTDRDAILSELELLLLDLYQSEPKEYKESLLALKQAWQNLAEFGKASGKQTACFTALTQAIEALAETLSQAGPFLELTAALPALENAALAESESEQDDALAARWQQLRDVLAPIGLLTQEQLPEAIMSAQALLQAYEKQQEAKNEAEQQLIRQINGLIRKGNDAIKQGHLRRAGGISKSLAEKQQQLQAILPTLPEFLSNKLEQYRLDFAKLQDWQSYAVLPKKEALVEQMQGLVESELDPQSLSELIKELQQEWKSLSKGGQNQHQELWQAFHEAAQAAYKPCQLYFEQLAQLRAANLEQRQQLANELTEYAANDNWQGIDWKAVDNLLKVAKTQWRSLSPTERQATKIVQKQFDQAISCIQAKLHGEYDANIALKEALVKQAGALEAEEDLRVATEQVKKLQSRWQEIGITPRSVDQKLWQRFRTACNAVFERRSEQSTAFKAELQEHKEQAQQLIAQLTELCAAELDTLLAKRAEVDALKAEFNNLGPLPRADVKPLQTAFYEQLNRFADKISEQKQTEKSKKWQDFFLLGELISKYEAALGTGSETEINDLEQSVEKQLAALIHWPAGGEAVIRDRLATCNKLDKQQQEANQTKLRQLCIRMEIINDKATPAEDQALRMAHQVERLKQDFGQGAIDELDSLKLEWVSVGAVEPGVYQSLFQRFIA